jgi:tetratricopeptide (TPR) repeat protein
MKSSALFFLIGFALFALSVHAQNAPKYKSVADGVDLGMSYLSGEKYDEAYSLFMALLREAPDNSTVNILLARSALLAKHPYQAIMAYERIIERYPSYVDFNQEIAEAYIALGDNITARRYLEKYNGQRAIARRPPPKPNRFEARGSIRVGGIYDSNANQGPAENYLKLGDYFFTLKDAKAEESYAAYFGFNLDGSYRLSDTGSWRAVGDFGVYLKNNFSEKLKELDRDYSQYYRLALGLRGAFSTRLIDMRLKAETFDYNFYQTVYIYGADINFIQAAGRSVHFLTALSGDKRDYARSTDYSGLYFSGGEYIRVFLGGSKHYITAGGRYMLASAEAESNSYNGWEASVHGGFTLPLGVRFSPKISWTQENYDGKATSLDRENRKDTRIGGGASLSFAITKFLLIDAAYQYFNNSSNSELYEYDRHIGSLGLDLMF